MLNDKLLRRQACLWMQNCLTRIFQLRIQCVTNIWYRITKS